MKVCNVFIFMAGFAAFAAAAQTQDKNSLTVPTSPAMPTITAPAMGNGFYAPGQAGFYQGQRNVPATTPKEDESTSAKETASAATGSSASGLLQTNNNAASYAAASKLSDALTAGSLNSMNSMGMLGSFSGLLGADYSGYTNGQTTKDQLMLKQILDELNALKAKIPQNTEGSENGFGEGTAVNVTGQNGAAAPVKSGPSILRFVVNGIDVLSSCKTVFFSKPENDGSFLLTADRKYNADGKIRTETFHLLFRATGTKNSSTSFTVTPAIVQDYENTASLVYKVCQEQHLTASKTGNLVTLKCYSAGVKTDLLVALE